jgi:glycosyltransferase involved in cell wall biosynthesis
MHPPRLVTFALPIYKRLQYLPSVLEVVQAQDYPAIELIVSDNGMNGRAVQDLVKRHYHRPHKCRQNSTTVDVSVHFNQILDAASGEFFVIMGDDDEISPNFISELVGRLERDPQASIAFGGQETFQQDGTVIGRSIDTLPPILPGEEFLTAMWREYRFGFQSVSTFVARTERIRATGGYPNFARGTHIDDALVVKLCLGSHVVFSSRCVFRNRYQESSLGWSVSTRDLAKACRQFMRFLEEDDTIRRFALVHPSDWRVIKDVLIETSWSMYLSRWQHLYKKRLSRAQWLKAAFAMPFIPAYYKGAVCVLRDDVKAVLRRLSPALGSLKDH